MPHQHENETLFHVLHRRQNKWQRLYAYCTEDEAQQYYQHAKALHPHISIAIVPVPKQCT